VAQAYRWDDIPGGGIYTTVNDVLGVRKTQSELPFYEIDKRTAAVDAIKAHDRRVHDREDDVIDSFRSPLSLDESVCWPTVCIYWARQ
jgi:hypothetical protein